MYYYYDTMFFIYLVHNCEEVMNPKRNHLKLVRLCFKIGLFGGDNMEIIDIVTIVVFFLPALIAVLRRKKYGILYAIIVMASYTVLIAGFSEMIYRISLKFASWDSFYLSVVKVTRYQSLFMEDIVFPALRPIFNDATVPFVYFATLGVYVVISVLAAIFVSKKKKREQD